MKQEPAQGGAAKAAIGEFLASAGLLAPGERFSAEPLTGGVSSDIWKIESGEGCLCIKSALAKLRTAQDWYAPVTRNATEVDWFRYVGARFPELVPEILAHDPARGMFAMTYLPAGQYPVWKDRLLAGQVDAGFAAKLGASLAAIHSVSAHDAQIAERFPHYADFCDLRISPYLRHLGHGHPGLRPVLYRLEQSLAANRKALVHGDMSPKNILASADGPVILDAEAACHGDPAFDVAFCLNHLLLKMVVRPASAAELAASFRAFADFYLQAVEWEPASDIRRRTAALLPALLLARIDGKSPVEYIQDEADKARVRGFALAKLQHDHARGLEEILDPWVKEFA